MSIKMHMQMHACTYVLMQLLHLLQALRKRYHVVLHSIIVFSHKC